MASLNEFWQFLNTDVKDIPWGELAEKGIEAVSASNDLGETWEEHKSELTQLAPHFDKVEPFFKVLSDPNAQMVISGLPFVSIGIGLLRIYLDLSKTEPTFDNSIVLVAQLAYLQSLEAVLEHVADTEKLKTLSLKNLLETQITRLDTEKLTSNELKMVTSRFRESKLAGLFGTVLVEQLQQAGLGEAESKKLSEQVSWGTPRYLYQAIAEAGETVEPLTDFYRTGGQQEQDRYISIDAYLKNKISPLPTEQVFDESDPLITFDNIYVPLNVQPLTQSGEEKDTGPVNIHEWAQNLLEQTGPRKVMFIEGNAGQGKSVFCRMFAAEVGKTPFSYIPLLIRLRSLRAIENKLTKTLENCPDLEPVEFVGREGWLKDKNTRFLIILDGFDELLLQGRSTGGLQKFLQQVSDFQERSHHQCLVTGRSLALQGMAQRITQNKILERVKLQPMNDALQEQWLKKWEAIFGGEEVSRFSQFLNDCPREIGDNLAREPLLIYLLARLHREKQLSSEMFANAAQESQAKLRIYRGSVNWVLEKQRQDENVRLSGLDDPDDLREVLQEAALCIVQSGNETAQLSMLKARFQDSANPVATSLKTAKETIGQSEDKALNNLLTTFYLRPGERDKRGSVEFAHKSFGEYLFAERLIAAFENWTELDRRQLDDRTVHGQIYDLLGFGGLSIEIVEYVFELLEESIIDKFNLFQRLQVFYKRWCDGEFLDQAPNENLPQKKFLQLREQTVALGLKQVDIFAGLNILIILFRLHAGAQSEAYPNLSDDEPKPEIWFHPCGEPDAEQFDSEKLLRIIHYADSLQTSTFTKTVGPHLSKVNLSNAYICSVDLYEANLSNANLSKTNLSGAFLRLADLSSANLRSADLTEANIGETNLSNANLSDADLSNADLSDANLFSVNFSNANFSRTDLFGADLSDANLSKVSFSEASLFYANLSNADLSGAHLSNTMLYNTNLSNAILLSTQLVTAQSLTKQQLEGDISPLICNTALPIGLEAYQDRDRDKLPAILRKRYPNKFESLEAAEKYIKEQHSPSS